jgi:DNA excision repair protein ERCC-4
MNVCNQVNAISTKISQLALQFPNLRIFWSRSPQQTADIFSSIMYGHEVVDVDKAVSVGASAANVAEVR